MAPPPARGDSRGAHGNAEQQPRDPRIRTVDERGEDHEGERAAGDERCPEPALMRDQRGRPGSPLADADPPADLHRARQSPSHPFAERDPVGESDRNHDPEPGRDVIRTGRAAAPRRMLEERAPGEQRAGGEERQRETSGDVRAWRLVGLAELPGVPDDHGERSEPEREAEELEPDAVRIDGERTPGRPAPRVRPAGKCPAIEFRRGGREQVEEPGRERHRGGKREADEGPEPCDTGRVRAGASPPPLVRGDGEQTDGEQARRPEEPRNVVREEGEPQRETLEGEEHPPVGHAVGGRAHARSLGPCGWR